jgi:hypothetical protein
VKTKDRHACSPPAQSLTPPPRCKRPWLARRLRVPIRSQTSDQTLQWSCEAECFYAPADCQRRAMSIGVLIQRAGMVTMAPGAFSVLARARRICRTVKATLLSRSSSAIQNQVWRYCTEVKTSAGGAAPERMITTGRCSSPMLHPLYPNHYPQLGGRALPAAR